MLKHMAEPASHNNVFLKYLDASTTRPAWPDRCRDLTQWKCLSHYPPHRRTVLNDLDERYVRDK